MAAFDYNETSATTTVYVITRTSSTTGASITYDDTATSFYSSNEVETAPPPAPPILLEQPSRRFAAPWRPHARISPKSAHFLVAKWHGARRRNPKTSDK